jgi:hypothetical protein
VVCDTAAVVAIMNELAGSVPRGPGRRLYDEARARGLTLAVPYIVARKAAALYLADRAVTLLGAFLFPERYRAADDLLQASGRRGVWWVERRRPELCPTMPHCSDGAATRLPHTWPLMLRRQAGRSPPTTPLCLHRCSAETTPCRCHRYLSDLR